ncbi:MAG: hypothetical protein WBC93_00955, partial [Sulfitobacter sp.]
DLATVQAAAMDVMLRVRSRMMRLPAVLANQIDSNQDTVDIQIMIDDSVREALTELASDWTN